MGLFDTVLVNCPNCGKEHKMQSKSGECLLEVYTLAYCPPDVLEDVNRHAPVNCECGTSFMVENRHVIDITEADNEYNKWTL